MSTLVTLTVGGRKGHVEFSACTVKTGQSHRLFGSLEELIFLEISDVRFTVILNEIIEKN